MVLKMNKKSFFPFCSRKREERERIGAAGVPEVWARSPEKPTE